MLMCFRKVRMIMWSSADLPPAVYMHSWGGKLGMLESSLKMKKYGDRFYFGFSSFANLRENCRKTAEVIAAVPADRRRGTFRASMPQDFFSSDCRPADHRGASHCALECLSRIFA
jgi:hypothetical protein